MNFKFRLVMKKAIIFASHCHVSNHTFNRVFRGKDIISFTIITIEQHDFIYRATPMDIFSLSNYCNEYHTP
ncbi:hypothetical protein EUGRSUZ_H01038 [Eucalyptus grandis]|uniref:Uncharacterized protein n=2 Tax=Eucalyptus grandis TaxID=71139 RepID=A0ACC3JN25_EUCGR|nr:hypothetical protein EUGRSUZ_H01038 [Eucalyptus grandis]